MSDVLQDRIDTLEEAIWRIQQWADAYPTTVFHEPTKDEWKRAHEAIKGAGLGGIDCFSASNMRHIVKGVGEIARAALRDTPAPPETGKSEEGDNG